LLKVTFNIPYGVSIAGNSPQGLCLPLPGGGRPRLGETWIVDIANRISTRSLYVKLVRRWKGLLTDYESIQKGQPDFRKGLLVFRDGVSFPLSDTSYARLWEDYLVLFANTNAVIIRQGTAVRWRKKGKPPEELPLYRFATKYKHQPLLGDREDVDCFLSSIERLIAQAIEESKLKKMGAPPEIDSVREIRGISMSSL
jgi:hypothetical protein